MKAILGLLLIMFSVWGAEFSIGRGSYESRFSVLDFMKHDVHYDTTVFRLKIPHSNFAPRLFWYLDGEYFTSDTKRATCYFAIPMADQQFPLFGSVNDRLSDLMKFVPAEGDFESVGGDFNFGAGYDLLSFNHGGYVGVALNLGATMPMIRAKNLYSRAKLAYRLIKKWDLDVGTYKIGPRIQAKVPITSVVYLEGSTGFGFQKAYVESELFKSDVDSTGRYSNLDFAVHGTFKKWDLSLGYRYQTWHVNRVDVNLFNFFQFDLFRPFKLDLKNHYTYFGVEYHF